MQSIHNECTPTHTQSFSFIGRGTRITRRAVRIGFGGRQCFIFLFRSMRGGRGDNRSVKKNAANGGRSLVMSRSKKGGALSSASAAQRWCRGDRHVAGERPVVVLINCTLLVGLAGYRVGWEGRNRKGL